MLEEFDMNKSEEKLEKYKQLWLDEGWKRYTKNKFWWSELTEHKYINDL